MNCHTKFLFKQSKLYRDLDNYKYIFKSQYLKQIKSFKKKLI